MAQCHRGTCMALAPAEKGPEEATVRDTGLDIARDETRLWGPGTTEIPRSTGMNPTLFPPHPALPCPALPCPALPCPALPCPALPCPALPCPALPCPTPKTWKNVPAGD